MDEKDWIILRLMVALSKSSDLGERPWDFYQFSRATIHMVKNHGRMTKQLDQLLKERDGHRMET